MLSICSILILRICSFSIGVKLAGLFHTDLFAVWTRRCHACLFLGTTYPGVGLSLLLLCLRASPSPFCLPPPALFSLTMLLHANALRPASLRSVSTCPWPKHWWTGLLPGRKCCCFACFEGWHVECSWNPPDSVNLFLRSTKSNCSAAIYKQTRIHTLALCTQTTQLHVEVSLCINTRLNIFSETLSGITLPRGS